MAQPDDFKKNIEEGSDRFPDFEHEYTLGKWLEARDLGPGKYGLLSSNGVLIAIQVISKQIIRIRYGLTGQLAPDFSYALDPDKHWPGVDSSMESDEDHVLIQTSKIELRLSKADLSITISEKQSGRVLLQEATPFQAKSSILKGTHHLEVALKAPTGTAYYGLGDKSGNTDLRGAQFENWNTDAFAYKENTDPLYRAIPFFYQVNESVASGVFLHNTYRSHFDFDSEEEGLCRFYTEGGEMDYFFIFGPELRDVACQYMDLTGKPEMPPLWALGFHQCRWSYYPEQRVRELARQFREHQIPCDAIYLDIDYMDNYKCFTWNQDYFPDPAGMIRDLQKEGFRTVVMIDPGIKMETGYHVYESGMEADVFCRRSTGETMIGPVWPPVCVWPDFTDPEVREWWKPLYQELYVDQQIDGFWNDMNEPAVFKITRKTFPDHVMHHYEGHRSDHRRAHNIYGMQMSRATQEGLKMLRPEKRPFVLTRASFSGGQRFAAVWTGDNVASWDHLAIANRQSQRLSISGFSLVGSDIGGFAKQPDGELFTRWVQLGIFHPIFRIHSMGNNVDGATETDTTAVAATEKDNRLDQEPWSFGEPYTSRVREAIELRYRLLPYLYTAFWQNYRTGMPVLQNLAFVDQSDPICLQREDEFLFGEALLIRPVLEPGAKELSCYLPKGKWYDYLSGKAYEGGKTYDLKVTPDSIPMFAKAGSVIPHFPVQQYTGQEEIQQVSLKVYPGNGSSEWYEDTGEGYDYQQGQFLLHQFNMTNTDAGLSIRQSVSGAFNSPCQTFQIELLGFQKEWKEIQVDGKPLKSKTSKDGITRFTLSANFKELTLR